MTSEHAITGVEKERAYNWTVSNKPPVLAYMDKDELFVDHQYQRKLNERKRINIAKKLNWIAMGVLLVAKRKNGLHYIIDGQHRLAAAKSRTDIRMLPVAIYQIEGGVPEEASDFLQTNTERKPLTGTERIAAQITKGDTTAIRVRDMIHEAGRTIGGNGPTTVACVTLMKGCLDSDADAFERVWPVIVEISRGFPIDGRMVSAFHYLECRIVKSDGSKVSLSDTKISRALVAMGHAKIMRGIAEAANYYRRGGNSIFASGVLKLLNVRRQKPFSISGQKLSDSY